MNTYMGCDDKLMFAAFVYGQQSVWGWTMLHLLMHIKFVLRLVCISRAKVSY